jgi:hypothetical protein
MDENDCVGCCQTAYSEGFNTFANAVSQCECVSPGVCESECESDYCAGSDPGTTCNTCLDDSLAPSGGCYTPVSDACDDDSNCVLYLECTNACPSM